MSREKKPRGKKQSSDQSATEVAKSLFDLLARAECRGALEGVSELTWIFFLRVLDARESRECDEANGRGLAFAPTLVPPYRWRDWAAPDSPLRQQKGAKVLKFVHSTLLPGLRALKTQPEVTVRQRMVSEVVAAVERSAITTEKHFLQVLDEVHEISGDAVHDQHIFTLAPASFSLAELYEELLLRLSAKASDGGQHFTPRDIVRAMVRVLDPKIGRTVYDPACGTGGFLAETYEYLRAKAGHGIVGEELSFLRQRTFHGRENEAAVGAMAVANLTMHGIDEPHIWHEHALVRSGVSDAPQTFDYVVSELPTGGKESKEVQELYEFKTPATQVLYLQNLLGSMRTDGRAGLILESGTLSRVDSEAFVRAKRQLLDECDVYCILHLPPGALASVGANARMHMIFFDKGRRTDRIWYYDLSDAKVSKKTPLTLAHFEEFLRLLPERAESDRSWTEDFDARWRVAHEKSRPHREAATAATELASGLEAAWRAAHGSMSSPEELQEMEAHWKSVLREAQDAEAHAAEIESTVYDLISVHPNSRRAAEVVAAETRTAEDLLTVIEEQGRAVDDALARLKALLAGP